jgi:DUF1680 family protein
MLSRRLLSRWTLIFLLSIPLGLAHAQTPTGTTPIVPGVPGVLDRFKLPAPGAVRLEGFLGERWRKNAQVRLFGQSEEEMLAGFQRRPGSQARVGEHLGKWLHATTLAWANTGDQNLRAKLDRVVAALLATQQPDGYLGTYADGAHWGMGENEKWDVWVHKYDLLGLITYATYTGDKPSLEAARRIGDLLLTTFGPVGQLDLNERSTHVGLASGSILEPMILLYRATADDKYLNFARFIADHWEAEKGPRLVSALTQKGSVKEAADAKAYEMLSCLVGLCELYRATGENRYLTPALNAWKDIVENQLLPTGGGSNDGRWGQPRAYLGSSADKVGETCVTVSWLQLTQQLLRLTGEARFADEFEKTIYNHLAAAQRPDGAAWSYFTALDGRKAYKAEQNNCTSSGPRGWAIVPAFAYATNDDGIVVNLFASSTATLRLRDGNEVLVRQETDYPVSGGIKLTVTVPKPMTFGLSVRVPAWSSISHYGGKLKAAPGSYWLLRQTWSKSQTITLDLDISPRLVVSGGVQGGRVALVRGPQVLAVDARFNQVIQPLDLVTVASEKPQLKTAAGISDADGMPVYETEGVVTSDIEGYKAGARVPLRFVPFASAGAEGTPYHIWLTRPVTQSGATGAN